MIFSPDANKQAKELYFSRKIQKYDSQNLAFNGCNVGSFTSEEHLRHFLDEK